MNNRFYLKTAISRLLILVMVLSLTFGAAPSTVGAAEIKSDGYTWGITEETWTAFLEKNIDSVYLGTGYEGHLQSFAIDDDMQYIYASFTHDLVKVAVDTGEIVGTVTGFPGHLGGLTYYDGRVYGALNYKGRSYLTVFECDEVTGTRTYDLKDETFIDCMSTILLHEPTNDYNADPALANYGMCGIDGITTGKAPDTGETVLMVSYSINGDTDEEDYDYDYNILIQYNFDTFLEPDGSGGTQIKPDYKYLYGPADNPGPTHSNKYFIYTGNTNYGVQNLEYDSVSNDYILAVYRGNTSDFSKFIMYHVDCDVPIQENVTLEYLGKNAEAYAEKGLDKGNVLTLAQIGEVGIDGVVWGSFQNPEGGVDTGIEHLYGDYFFVSNSAEDGAGTDIWTATAMLYQYDRENDVYNKVNATVEDEELLPMITEDFDDAATGVLSLADSYNGWSAGGIMDTTKSPYMQIATDSANAENKVMSFYRDGSVNTDTDSKIMYLKYDLSDIMGADSAEEVEDAERYAKLKYSVRPNVQGNKFNVLLGELGTISLDMSKSCVRYNGASDTKLTYQNGSWYETELYVDLKEQKLSVFVNDTQYFKEAALSASQISYIQFYPDRYDAEKATGNLTYSYDLDDISFGAIDEDTYRNEVGVLGEGELLRESFNTVTTSAVRNTTTDAGWHKEYERDTTKSTITAGVDGDNNVASFKRMTSDYGYYHRLRYNLGETLTDGYYSLRFKLKSASATNKLFRVFFFDDDTTHTNEWVELYFNNDTAKKFYRIVGDDGAYTRTSLTKSFADKAVTEWYNVEIIFNLTDAEIGKTSLYIDGQLIFNDILADYKSSKTQNNGKLSGIAFGMGTTDATTLTDTDTDTATVDAEYMLDNIVIKKLETETTGVISADGKLTGISVNTGWIPAGSQKFVAAVYEVNEEGAPAALKGVSTAAASARGTSTLTLSKQLAYSDGDIIRVYFWDMGMLKPVGTLFSKTAQ